MRLNVRYILIVSLTALAIAGRAQMLDPIPTDTNLLLTILQAPTATAAWIELTNSERRPEIPAEWRVKTPSAEEQNNFLLPYIIALEDRAKNFYTRFPTDTNSLAAQLHELHFIGMAAELGATNQEARLQSVEKSALADPRLTVSQRFFIRRHEVLRASQAKESEGEGAGLAELEKGIYVLQKEFPNEPLVQRMLLEVAALCDGQKARGIVREILASDADDEVKEAAADLAEKLKPVGQPAVLQFQAVDGREVNTTQLKGKVVLIDFWATWCPPCVRAVPEVVATYDKLHDKGFEIVGVSLDVEKEALTGFVAAHKMTWPQHFDGLKYHNKYAQLFGINGVPTMWLLDKQGNLRDISGQYDLAGKVEKLLAE